MLGNCNGIMLHGLSLDIRVLNTKQVLHSQLPVALRRETSTKYPCCARSASE